MWDYKELGNLFIQHLQKTMHNTVLELELRKKLGKLNLWSEYKQDTRSASTWNIHHPGDYSYCLRQWERHENRKQNMTMKKPSNGYSKGRWK